jgi:hypothetical protein
LSKSFVIEEKLVDVIGIEPVTPACKADGEKHQSASMASLTPTINKILALQMSRSCTESAGLEAKNGKCPGRKGAGQKMAEIVVSRKFLWHLDLEDRNPTNYKPEMKP